MSFSSAYLLIFHGSRDPRSQAGTDRLAQELSECLGRQETTRWVPDLQAGSNSPMQAKSVWYPQVGTAALELAPPPLHEQIRLFANRALTAGCQVLEIVPLFLLPGVHVMEDIPAEIAQAEASLGGALKIVLCPYLGSHPGWHQLLAARRYAFEAKAWILLAHGSRRAGSHQGVEQLASQLGAEIAYWSVEPTLAQTVAELAELGHQQVGILPYFLFAGGITDAIAQQVEQLQQQFPGVQLYLAQPLENSCELAQLVLDLTQPI
uniref:Sirohydrochlorin chelatase n=1 Tax=Desertifilum tharense IPPAS B-1220 TaxID=1781255 RepID=A0ACD5H0J6_9CYAN